MLFVRFQGTVPFVVAAFALEPADDVLVGAHQDPALHGTATPVDRDGCRGAQSLRQEKLADLLLVLDDRRIIVSPQVRDLLDLVVYLPQDPDQAWRKQVEDHRSPK